MQLIKCNQIKEFSNNELLKGKYITEISTCGTITATLQIPIKSNPNKVTYFITIEDETGAIDAFYFNKQRKKFDKLLKVNNQVIITGKKLLDSEAYPETTPIIIQNVKLVK